MPKTKAEKVSYIREWRRNTYNEKRFNKPMREYFELKYRDSYNQYCHFYNDLCKKHPNAKDLTKTTTFKKWKTRQLNCESSDDDDEPETGPIETESESETEPIETESESETGPTDTEPETGTRPTDTEPETGTRPTDTEPETETRPTEAETETLPLDNIDTIQVDEIIQRIINELQQDEVVRELLNGDEVIQDNDEGIELDMNIELEEILEPFDYELEVDF